MTDAPDREAIIDAVARERPWRTPSYLILFFLRRWAVVLFTVSFMLATRQHWTLIGVATLAALWFDLKVTPNAVDLRMSDREFVRKIYDLEVFESDLREEHRKIIKRIGIFILFFLLALSAGCIFVDYDTEFTTNKKACPVVPGFAGTSAAPATFAAAWPGNTRPRPNSSVAFRTNRIAGRSQGQRNPYTWDNGISLGCDSPCSRRRRLYACVH